MRTNKKEGGWYQRRRGLENGERMAASVEMEREGRLADKGVGCAESGLLESPQHHDLLRCFAYQHPYLLPVATHPLDHLHLLLFYYCYFFGHPPAVVRRVTWKLYHEWGICRGEKAESRSSKCSCSTVRLN